MNDKSLIVKDWRFVDLTFGLIYPNSYKLANSSYTIRLLYHMINENNKFVCERIFLPEKIKYPATKDLISINQIRSIENKILPNEFDVLGFSVHYENDFKNILWLLEKSKIPWNRNKRTLLHKKNEVIYPLIIAGGPVITSNPLPLTGIFDAFFIGDSEPNLITFLNEVREWKLKNYNLSKLFNRLKNIDGIFLPALNNQPKRLMLKDLDESPNPSFQTISRESKEDTVFERNFFIEINRGCPFRCKFCISSFHNAPFRNKSFTNIINLIEEGIKRSTFEKISLIGSCVSSHPKFKEICRYIIYKRKKLSIPSIRLDHLDKELITIFEEANMKTITLAPETGSETLRYELGKKISDQKIIEVAKNIRESKIRNIKLYFLIGLPSETEEDTNAIINLIINLDSLEFERGALKININPFIPKLNTPYGNFIHYYLEDNLHILKERFITLEKELKQLSSVKLKFQNPKEILKNAKLQTMFSLGDSTISEVLIKYYQNGAHFRDFIKAEKVIGFSSKNYLKRIQDGYLPWII